MSGERSRWGQFSTKDENRSARSRDFFDDYVREANGDLAKDENGGLIKKDLDR
jgi:hypothetical protein